MRIKFIKNGIYKYCNSLNLLSNKTGINKLYLYSDCIWSYLRYGCVLNQYVEGNFYLRRSFERNHIFTYRRWKKVIRHNNKKYIHILKNKVEFNSFFHHYIKREWHYSKNLSYNDFMDFFQRHGNAFIKPIDGLEGNGCQLLFFEKGRDYQDLYNVLKKSGYLIEEVIKQHPSMIFGNKSVNTIRAYTIFDNKRNRAYCFKTTLRVGVGNSIVDNSHTGGVSYEIDLTTGIIDSHGWGHNDNEVIFHPRTNICMIGVQIPYWKQVIELCENAAEMIPQVRYIGWDIAITPQGPILVEGNNTPDLDIMEFVGSYGYYNIIKSHLNNDYK